MLKHMPSGTAVVQQHQQQQQQQPQKQLDSQYKQSQVLKKQHNQYHYHNPKQTPLPPSLFQSSVNAIIRTPFSRSIQPLNVSTISHQTATTNATITPKLISNGYNNGSLEIPTIMNTTSLTSCSSRQHQYNLELNKKHRIGARETLTSLGLLCLGKSFY